jgi:hypothetical protein
LFRDYAYDDAANISEELYVQALGSGRVEDCIEAAFEAATYIASAYWQERHYCKGEGYQDVYVCDLVRDLCLATKVPKVKNIFEINHPVENTRIYEQGYYASSNHSVRDVSAILAPPVDPNAVRVKLSPGFYVYR